MRELKILDISEINCWIVNLKPFNPDTKWDEILNFQNNCVENHIFGIGWSESNFKGGKLTDDNKNEFLKIKEKSDKKNFNAIKKAVNGMSSIQVGDIVMMRLRNGHYYIGMVEEDAYYADYIDRDRLSWIFKVKEWKEFKTDEELPAEITGRFSQRQQSTITRVATYRSKLLMIAIYEKEFKEIIIDVPKIHITQDNFARALNYMELENLVCKYIYEKHKNEGYMLLPSSGKISQIKYEFTFISDDKPPITCQVKNQNRDTMKISSYKEDSSEYKRIYLFSGNDNIEKDEVVDNVYIIDKKELFETLMGFKYMHKRLNNYYSFENESSSYNMLVEKLKNAGEDLWKERKRFSEKSKIYKLSSASYGETDDELSVTRWISFIYPGFFYSEDFDCFIISWRNDRTEETISSVNELIKQKR